jgi:hypothetical protein
MIRSTPAGVLKVALLAAWCLAGALPALALQPSSSTMTDAQVRQAIIQESVGEYLATGHPCACPYNSARNGSSCGARSAYSRPGGWAPKCYPADVTDGMVADWRRTHR